MIPPICTARTRESGAPGYSEILSTHYQLITFFLAFRLGVKPLFPLLYINHVLLKHS
jgi:hypothetical protein